MKESITKFDLEAAFKALDELETPKCERGIAPNRAALNEIFTRKTKFDALFEEYYDISNTEELSTAQDNREAEIAKAKLARIEKIVDLDAASPDELLSSYVGKYIIQCPQCMTLFYKNQEDVENSEDDESTVNVGEVCQHCGNESGYTLIGKVGAAEEETAETEETTEEGGEEETVDISAPAEESEGGAAEETVDAEAASEGGDEDFDLDAELAALEGGEEEEEDDSTKEESFAGRYDGNYLLEQLNEEVDDMDISDAEFKELLNSDEFSRTVSDKAAGAMLANMDEALKTCEELEEEVAAETEDDEALTEGGLGLLAKTIGKKLGQVGNKIKDKASASIDKFADNTMTTAEKADWIMRHTLRPDVKHIQIGKDGKMIPNEKDQKFNNYVVIGFDGYFSDGDEITASPTKDNEDLVFGMPAPQFKKTYAEAESLAKGWSLKKDGGGPAFIMLCKDKDIDNAAYLHQFFRGELDTRQDKMEEYFQEAKQDLEGKEHIAAGGGIKDAEAVGNGEEVVTPDKLAVGDVIAQGGGKGTITKIEPSSFGGGVKVTLKMENGTEKTPSFKQTQKVKRLAKGSGAAQESFNAPKGMHTVMENLEELNEDVLESLIATSLIESYKNVAGFRLTGCEYVKEALEVKGKVFFESGCHRELTYKFNRAAAKGDKVAFKGLNEKLGADKSFVLVGKKNNKTFVAESFKRV